MANEAVWEVIPSNFTASDGRSISNSNTEQALGDVNNIWTDLLPKESFYVQVGSQYLYSLKEHLIKAGWTVVSSSYRKGETYVDNSDPTKIGFWSLNLTTNANLVSPSATWTGITDGTTDYYTSEYFTATDNDGWIPQNGYRANNDPSADSSSFYWGATGVGDANPAWSVIYPGYAPVLQGNLTGMNVSLLTNEQKRRGLLGHFQLYAVSGQKVCLGRSWILLKCPQNFKEPKPSGHSANYHILIDYVNYDEAPFNTTTAGKFPIFNPGPANSHYDPANKFGNSINILIFPDYNPGDGLTNVSPGDAADWNSNDTYVPAPWIRPSHLKEMGCTIRTINSDFGSTYFNFISNVENIHYINTISANTVDSEYPGTVLLGTTNGIFNFSIVLGTIADPIADEIVQRNAGLNTSVFSGKRMFMFWSGMNRKAAAAVDPLQINSILGTTDQVTKVANLQKTIFDSRDKYSSIFYYNNYSPLHSSGTPKYDYRPLNTCIPTFLSDTSTTKSGASFMLATTPFAKATSDYTYVEWPLPLIYVQGISKNFNYAGRMMDIKLGPASAPNGILAKESGSFEYDRVLMGGIWFPYAGTDPLLF